MASGILFVLSESLDFALQNPIYILCVALVSFFAGLEVSGYGAIVFGLQQRREKKLNDDLVRVRELQQQLGVLRALRSKKKSTTSKSSKSEEGDDGRPKRESKVRFSSKKLSFSSLVNSSMRSSPAYHDHSSNSSDSSDDDDNNFVEFISKTDNSSKEIGDYKEKTGDEVGAVCNAYEAAKDAWTYGRHETPLAPLLGFAEGITKGTVGLFGTDMKGLDDALKPHLASLDEHFRNKAPEETEKQSTEATDGEQQ